MLKKDITINEDSTIKDALKKLNKSAEKVLVVTDKGNRLLGAVTDGDIRRCILEGKSLDDGLKAAINKNPIFIKKGELSQALVRKLLVQNKIDLIPIVDKSRRVVDYITWDYAFSNGKLSPQKKSVIKVPVVIMAGGRGLRLDPFTRILPKPLIPIGEKPIVEVIIDEFRNQGAKNFHLSLNHKAGMVESYFNNIQKSYKLNFVIENKILGTAGSLKLMENKLPTTFLVCNCDVIVKANYENVIKYHKKEKAWMTVLTSIQHHKIPYGVIRAKAGKVNEITEKPEHTININTGVYVLDKKCMKYIKKNKSCDMTDLIKQLIKDKHKVVMYPVNEDDYIDVGQWEEYKKAMNSFQKMSEG